MVKVKNVGFGETQIQTTMSYYLKPVINKISSVQFSCSVMSDSLWPHGLQHTKPPCPSLTPGVYPNSCPLSRWCHPTISSSVIPFSSHLQSCPASGSSQISQLFTWGGQSIGVSASTSVQIAITKKDKWVGQDVEKNGHLHTVGGNVNWYSLYGKQCFLRKLKIEPYDPAVPLLGIYLRETESLSQTEICTFMFISTFKTFKIWKQPQCPARNEWIKKMWYPHTHSYIHTME